MKWGEGTKGRQSSAFTHLKCVHVDTTQDLGRAYALGDAREASVDETAAWEGERDERVPQGHEKNGPIFPQTLPQGHPLSFINPSFTSSHIGARRRRT